MARTFPIGVGDGNTVTGLHYPAKRAATLDATLILAHGAGAGQSHPFMTAFATGLAGLGLDMVTFDFLYMERGRKAPDPAGRLESCYRAIIAETRARIPSAGRRLLVGGKSMGGRIASQVVAGDDDDDDLGVAGLVFLGYPLHPPGRPDKLRSAHLPSIGAPMLFVQGSRDTFGTPDELAPILSPFGNATLHVIQGGDHSLKVGGKQAPPVGEVHDAVQRAIIDWCTTAVIRQARDAG